MRSYDIDMLKKNIKSILEDRNITQTELGRITGINQSRISAVLSGKTADCFTVQQLADIAIALNMSVDSLMGLEKPEEEHKDITLADVCEKLFEIDDIVGLHIGQCDTDEVILHDSFPVPEKCLGIYFKNEHLIKILGEWKDIKSINSNNETKYKILKLWEKDSLEAYSKKKKKWNFRDKKEQGKYLANELVKSSITETPPFDLFAEESIDIIKWYMEQGYIYFDFENYERNIVQSELKKYFEQTME